MPHNTRNRAALLLKQQAEEEELLEPAAPCLRDLSRDPTVMGWLVAAWMGEGETGVVLFAVSLRVLFLGAAPRRVSRVLVYVCIRHATILSHIANGGRG